VVPEFHVVEKKLNGTNPQRTKTGKCWIVVGKIFVKMKVRTDIIMIGLSRDQKAPKDMFRYRMVKSLRINLERRNR
jgi:hypothetical protein